MLSSAKIYKFLIKTLQILSQFKKTAGNPAVFINLARRLKWVS